MNEAQLQTSSAAFPSTPRTQQGLTFARRFSTEGVSPYDEVQWERRTASITDTKGNTIFEQKDVEVPGGLVDDGDQHCGLEVPARADGHAGAGDRRAATGGPRGGDHPRLGHGRRLLCHARWMPPSSTTSWRTCC